MAKTGRQAQGEVGSLTSYWDRTHWPLQGLIFLLPLVVIYELGTLLYIQFYGDNLLDLRAEVLLAKFLNFFGASGVYLPGLILLVVLICWHMVRRDPWKPEPKLYLMMFAESLLLTVPLLVFAAIFEQEKNLTNAVSMMQATAGYTSAGTISEVQRWLAGILLSIGAGVYEELVFRLILIAIIHAILVDLIALPPFVGAIGAVIGSSLAFAGIHEVHSFGMFMFYTAAGVYFALIYLSRGFGIVVAAHAFYDIIAVSTSFFYALMQN